MSMSIEEKIVLLPSEKQRELNGIIMDPLYDRWWFIERGLDYVNQDMRKIKEALFEDYQSSQRMTLVS